MIDMFENSTAVQVTQGITIGSGGATFYGQGAFALDGLTGNTQMGAIVLNPIVINGVSTGELAGGSAASPVTITWKSNVSDATSDSGQGVSQGCPANLYVDNHATLFAKWVVNGGEIVPNSGKTDHGLTGNNDLGFGAVPSAYLADAITLDRETTGTSATDVHGNAWQNNVLAGGANIRVDKFGGFTIPANRGITLGPGGGGLHPADSVTAANNQLTIASVITGPGQLRVMLDINQAVVILNRCRYLHWRHLDHRARLWSPQLSTTIGNTFLEVTTTSLPAHQSGFHQHRYDDRRAIHSAK